MKSHNHQARIVVAQKRKASQASIAGRLLSSHIIAGNVSGIHEFTNTVIEKIPDLVIFDIDLPGGDVIAAAKYLKFHYPEIKMICVTPSDSPLSFAREDQECIDGFLLKDSNIEELQWSINKVLSGKKFISPKLRHLISKPASNEFKYDGKQKIA